MTSRVTINAEEILEVSHCTRDDEGQLLDTKTYIIPPGKTLILDLMEFQELTITQPQDLFVIGA
jgi:hypothetical protein